MLNDKIIIYQTNDGKTAIDVKLEDDTVWLSQAQMAELFQKDRTVIIISHSLSQILDSDKIFVMKKGRVVESGTHPELMQMDGTYKEIFDASARSLNLDKLMSSYREN